jgi:uncharacterized protein
MVSPKIDIEPERIAAFCRRHHITRLRLFGSVLRDDFGPQSDIDVLAEFDPEHMPGWEIIDMEEELGTMFGGRKVDMVDPKFLNRHLRDRILRDALVQYEQG